MSGADWLVCGVLVAVLVATLILDGRCNAAERTVERAARDASHRRLMRELERQP